MQRSLMVFPAPPNATPLRRTVALAALALLATLVAGCAPARPTSQPEFATDGGRDETGAAATAPAVAAPPKARALSPVPLWKDGKVTGELDAAQARATRELVIDLGEQWVPYIFSERSMLNEQAVPQSTYRATYL